MKQIKEVAPKNVQIGCWVIQLTFSALLNEKTKAPKLGPNVKTTDLAVRTHLGPKYRSKLQPNQSGSK